MRRRHAMGLIAAALLALAVGPAHASPLELFGFGGRSPGLAGAGVADADGFDAVYLNPAGLGGPVRRHFAVGLQSGDLDLMVDGRELHTDRPTGRVIGAALGLPLGGGWRDRVGLGLGFLIPPSTLAKVQAPLPGQPYHAILANRTEVIGAQLAIGVALSPRWRVGAGVLVLAGLRGGIFVDLDGAGRITTTSEERLTADWAPILGVGYRAADRLRLGAVVRGASAVRYDVEVSNDLAGKLPLSLPQLRVAGTGQYDPLAVAVEAAWAISPRLTLFGQLAYQRWSAFPLPTENPLVGGEPQPAPGFHDTVTPRVALESRAWWHGAVLTARGGYAFVRSPAPEASGRQSFLDNDRHVGAAGLGAAWPDAAVPLHLDAWIQLHGLVGRRHAKDADVADPTFDAIDTGGHILAGGLVAGVDL